MWNQAPCSRATSARSASGSIAPVPVVPAVPTTATGTTPSRVSSAIAARSAATSIRCRASLDRGPGRAGRAEAGAKADFRGGFFAVLIRVPAQAARPGRDRRDPSLQHQPGRMEAVPGAGVGQHVRVRYLDHVGGRGAMIGTMESAGGSDAVAGGVRGAGARGIVSRPRLFGRLAALARVIVVSAPAGSGKTVLLRSWLGQAGVAGRAAWVAAGRGEGDPQQFWLSVTGALRQTAPGSALVRPVTAAPDLDGWAITERLLADLAPLDDRVWLVVDDVHELGADALRQLELLILRAPPGLRFVLAARHDVRLGLHRLRLEGEVAEIREPDLRFTVAEAAELFEAAGVDLPEVAPLVARTEGWAAGLRLAALALAGHPDPGRLAAEFSGTERTVAEYLLAEVLDRQPGPVRRLLLRTSILERVNGELAGLLTGDSGGERVLQDLEAANAFTVAVDAGRSWFRYHHLFADLLQLELRRTEPDQVAVLHRDAAGWFAGHGFPVNLPAASRCSPATWSGS